MFDFTGKDSVKRSLDKEIEDCFSELDELEASTEEYTRCADNLRRLLEMREGKKVLKVSPDVIATLVANSVWILLILKYEESDSILSKAFGFVLKGRV